MKLRMMVVLCAALALTVGVATATAGGGNSAIAKMCQKGGWKLLIRSSDGSSFANEEACVSYGAEGGTLIAKTKSQLDCEDLGGTFGPGPNLTITFPFTTVYWVCNGYGTEDTTFDEFYAMTQILSADCFADFPTTPGPNFLAEQHAATGGFGFATCGIEELP
jgi:hypothetical protein